jgi:hypothetical protein
MFIENVQRFVSSRDAPRWRAKSWDVTDVKGGKVSNLFSGYTETYSAHNTTTASFVLEHVNKK